MIKPRQSWPVTTNLPSQTVSAEMLIGSWVKDHILLFDLGYFKHELFSRIRENEGYFVSRLKASANPTIVLVLRTHRGNTIDLDDIVVEGLAGCYLY
jgi:putative transposase